MVWDPIVQYITMLFNYIGFMIMGNNRYIIHVYFVVPPSAE
jgi:hypothetical protein